MTVLYCKYWPVNHYTSGVATGCTIYVDVSDTLLDEVLLGAEPYYFYFGYGPDDYLNNTFPDVATALAYMEIDLFFISILGQANLLTGDAYSSYEIIDVDGVVYQRLSNKQDKNVNLDAYAGLTLGSGKVAVGTGANTLSQFDTTSYGRGLANLVNQAALQSAVGVSGTNTGDQDLSGLVTKTTTVNGHSLSGNVTVSKSDVGLGNVDNTADSAKAFSASQITSGTKTSAFISDFAEAAQDAVGGALSAEFVYNDAGNSIGLRARTFNVPSRTAGTAYQISTTRDADVTYKIALTSAATLILGSRATAALQYADDSGMTTNVVTVDADDFGVASGLLVTGYGTLKLSGKIPAGKYARITTAQVTGTPTIGAISGQEVLL